MLSIKHNEIPLPSNFIYLIFLPATSWYFYPLLSKWKKKIWFLYMSQKKKERKKTQKPHKTL